MKCDDCQLWISIYVDEALSDEQTVELFSHLSGCPNCQGFLRSILDIHNAIVSASRPRAPLSDRQFTFASVDIRGQSLPVTPSLLRSFWSRRLSLPISAAAMIVVVLLACLVGLTSLWMRSGAREEAGGLKVLFMARMPVVEVYAPRPAETVKTQ